MKSGIVLIPFVDSKTGNAYDLNDKFTGNKKRFEELLKAGLISDNKVIEEEQLEESNDNVDLEETENGNDDSEVTEESAEEEQPEESNDNVDLEETEE